MTAAAVLAAALAGVGGGGAWLRWCVGPVVTAYEVGRRVQRYSERRTPSAAGADLFEAGRRSALIDATVTVAAMLADELPTEFIAGAVVKMGCFAAQLADDPSTWPMFSRSDGGKA